MPQFAGSRVIYGGSAGPGLLTELKDGVDGLFLGRFAHDPAAVELILDETAGQLRAAGPRPTGGRRHHDDRTEHLRFFCGAAPTASRIR